MPHHSPPPVTPEARALLAAADLDLRAVEILTGHPDPPAPVVCFHAQQFIEQVIKAVLVTHGVVFRRTHDLGELAGLLHEHRLPPPLPVETMSRLNPFAVTLRYEALETDPVPVEQVIHAISQTAIWLGEQIDR